MVVRELFAAILGRSLQLPIPEPAIVEIDPRLAAVYPDLRESIAHAGPHFGSLHMSGGYEAVHPSSPFHGPLSGIVFDIFAWDMLARNEDRRVDKPNLLSDSTQFWLIDHEMSFAHHLQLFPPLPWELRGTTLPNNHVLFQEVRRNARPDCFDNFLDRLTQLEDEDIQMFLNALPMEWDGAKHISKGIDHLKMARDNIDMFRRGLLEAIT